MYKCIECGSEYDVKPDFCDCGNDTFVEDLPEVNDFTKQKKSLNKKGLLSWIIFSICLLLSVLILLFFPKIDTQDDGQEQEKSIQIIHEDIPDLNSFWIDYKPQKEEDVEPLEPVKVIMSIIKPKVEHKKEAKKENKNNNTNQKSQQAPAAQQKKVQQAQKSKTQQTSQPQTSQTTQTVVQYELLTYKNSLLQRLRSNIPFSEIEGEGECGIVFAIDSTGKLINRNFYFQSDNKSVNDAVYKMLMKTPKFNPPPSGYRGETLKIYLKLGANQYEMRYAK